jgi:hypothetical protein
MKMCSNSALLFSLVNLKQRVILFLQQDCMTKVLMKNVLVISTLLVLKNSKQTFILLMQQGVIVLDKMLGWVNYFQNVFDYSQT